MIVINEYTDIIKYLHIGATYVQLHLCNSNNAMTSYFRQNVSNASLTDPQFREDLLEKNAHSLLIFPYIKPKEIIARTMAGKTLTLSLNYKNNKIHANKFHNKNNTYTYTFDDEETSMSRMKDYTPINLNIEFNATVLMVDVIFKIDYDCFHYFYYDKLREYSYYSNERQLSSQEIGELLYITRPEILANISDLVLANYICHALEFCDKKYVRTLILQSIVARNDNLTFALLDKFDIDKYNLEMNEILTELCAYTYRGTSVIKFVNKYMVGNKGPFKPLDIKMVNEQLNSTARTELVQKMAMDGSEFKEFK